MKATIKLSPGSVGHLATLYGQPDLRCREISDGLRLAQRFGLTAWCSIYLMELVFQNKALGEN